MPAIQMVGVEAGIMLFVKWFLKKHKKTVELLGHAANASSYSMSNNNYTVHHSCYGIIFF